MQSSQHSPQNSIPPPSSLQSALQMDPNQHLQLQVQQSSPQPAQPSTKRRKRADGSGDDPPTPSEPRRLRRSHEACARCRSKKIKCDSKHPRCTACATAGTECNQEDRHRQTLTPRGYTERLEHQLAQCEALIKRQIPGFTKDNLDDVLAREGIDIGPPPPLTVFPPLDGRPFRPDQGPPPPKGYPPMYGPPHMMGYPHPPMMPYGPPYPQMPMQGPPGAYGMHPPPFPPQPGMPPYPPHVMHQQPEHAMPPPASHATRGTDPHGHDMSSAQALAKNFGVSATITSGLKLDPVHEDFPVDTSALPILEVPSPRDASHWVTVSVRRNSPAIGQPNTLSLYGPVSKSPHIDIWLPKDRNFANQIISVYFKRLNFHRPVYTRPDFDKLLTDLYAGVTPFHDPGHLCSIYLVFALGTLSELNDRACKANLDGDKDQFLGSSVAKKLMPHNWPTHDEFFERALGVKPDLRVSISSLQAQILLHWYLYIERQGRTLWRLVGSLVRLSIELGLHHDPLTQFVPGTNQRIFSDEEAQQRIRLWACVLVHDRGTSILLGRPLAIATSDSNTPHPLRRLNKGLVDFSEHFELSQPVVDIQADIINSLYAPTRQAGDTIMRNATRIIKSMTEFRRSLPQEYHYYFTGTNDWSFEEKVKLVAELTEDRGLTLLKIGIARILMLRALFSSKELSYGQKHKALVDAIITSHNVIVLHHRLIQFPDIAFFTSPIPLHIAAMVILYGHISKVECLPANIALEDVWMALDMIPRFRWRWERKDVNGGHPLIAKLVEHVMGVNLHAESPKGTQPPVLLCEPGWEEPMSPTLKSHPHTPILSPNQYAPPGNPAYPPQPRSSAHNGAINRSNSGGSTPPDKASLADVPQSLFYPFFPEAGVPPMGASSVQNAPNGPSGDYSQLLRVAAAAQDGYGGQPYLSEEKDGAQGTPQPTWGGLGRPSIR